MYKDPFWDESGAENSQQFLTRVIVNLVKT